MPGTSIEGVNQVLLCGLGNPDLASVLRSTRMYHPKHKVMQIPCRDSICQDVAVVVRVTQDIGSRDSNLQIVVGRQGRCR